MERQQGGIGFVGEDAAIKEEAPQRNARAPKPHRGNAGVPHQRHGVGGTILQGL